MNPKINCIDYINKTSFGISTAFCVLYSCTSHTGHRTSEETLQADSLVQDTIAETAAEPVVEKITPEGIQIIKGLLYDKCMLEDTYPYKDTTRSFQWDKIKEQLAPLENIQLQLSQRAILQNYKSRNGEAPLVKSFRRNAYGRVADTLGVERHQSVPLYLLTDTIAPERYGQDGRPTRFIEDRENFVKAEPTFTEGEWMIPRKYIKMIEDTAAFNKTIFVDRHNRNTTALERTEKGKWVVRSMNPSTTGLHRPPYTQETPLGMFVLQEKKVKMISLKDGLKETGGYAPCASRFTDGAYTYGVPVNEPRKTQIEYSWSLGTTPRSYTCVRDATFHAKFIFDWVPVNETIIFVLEQKSLSLPRFYLKLKPYTPESYTISIIPFRPIQSCFD